MAPPRGGLCELSPESDIRLLETVVTYNCSGNNLVFFFFQNVMVSMSNSPPSFFSFALYLKGWQQIESRFSQLIYTFHVEACQGITCPLLTLYKWVQSLICSFCDLNERVNSCLVCFLHRGTRSTFASLLPVGKLGRDRSTSVITATVLIEDHLGTTVVALKKYSGNPNVIRSHQFLPYIYGVYMAYIYIYKICHFLQNANR